MSNLEINFYVYAYLRNKNSITGIIGTPYYIGKGRGKRMFNKHYVMPTDKNYIVILEQNLTEIGAFAIERRLIRWWGRKDIRTGILNNLTDGGEGTSGRILSDNSKSAISFALLNKPKSESHKKKLSKAAKGRIVSLITREKMGIARRGRTFSEESSRKKSDAQKGKPRFHKTRGIPSKPLKGMRPCSTPCGEFISCAAASRHYLISKDTVGFRCKSKNYPDWKYV